MISSNNELLDTVKLSTTYFGHYGRSNWLYRIFSIKRSRRLFQTRDQGQGFIWLLQFIRAGRLFEFSFGIFESKISYTYT